MDSRAKNMHKFLNVKIPVCIVFIDENIEVYLFFLKYCHFHYFILVKDVSTTSVVSVQATNAFIISVVQVQVVL